MQLTSRPALSGKKSPTVHCTPLILDEQCWEDVKKYLPLLSFIPSGMGMSISLMVENGGPAMEWTQGLNQSKNLLFNVCTLLSSIFFWRPVFIGHEYLKTSPKMRVALWETCL